MLETVKRVGEAAFIRRYSSASFQPLCSNASQYRPPALIQAFSIDFPVTFLLIPPDIFIPIHGTRHGHGHADTE